MPMMDREQLIERVIKQIEEDVNDQDFFAIRELMNRLPDHMLEDYLPEEN